MQLALVGLAGIEHVRVLVPVQQLRVTYDPDKITPREITDAVRRAPAAGESGNYDAVPLKDDGSKKAGQSP